MTRIIFTALAAMAMAGCAVAPPGVDEQFGSTVLSLVKEQIANPAARAARATPATDGRVAKAIIDSYVGSFEPKPSGESGGGVSINIGAQSQ